MIRFRYVPSLQDYLAFSRHFLIRPLARLRWIGALLVAGYLVFPFAIPQTPRVSVWHAYVDAFPLLILPALLATTYLISRFTIRKRWYSTEQMRAPKDFQIDDEGVKITRTGASAAIDWSHFEAWSRVDSLYYLKTHEGAYQFFSATLVKDEEALKRLLDSKITTPSTEASGRKPAKPMRTGVLLWLLIVGAVLALYFYNPK